MQWFWVGIGGALGSLLRFFLQGRFQAQFPGLFPVGTLGVNLIGSTVIGALAGAFESAPISMNLRVFLIVGILGGFTTFSSFSLENLNLLRTGQLRLAFLYLMTSNVLGVGLACGGFLLARAALRAFAIAPEAG